MSHFIELEVQKDSRGSLIAIEVGRELPFPVRRVYYIYGSDGSSRGFHAHRELRQLMICLTGSCRVILDDGTSRSEILLDRPDHSVMIEDIRWREMHDISKDAVILVLASHGYDEADYIRDYDEFLRIARRGATK